MRAVFCFVLMLLPASLAADENWFQFRGPNNGDGHSTATGLPAEWSETENVVWKTAIHDRGWSSPVIWNDQVWLTTATEDGRRLFALCLDRESGRIIHDLKLFEVEEPQFCHALNSYASPSPVIEEGRVYVHFGSPGTACLDTDTGEILWTRRDLPCDHYRGAGSSPILFEDLLIIHYDGYDHQYIVALDKATGRTVWKQDRDVDYQTDNGDIMKAYCTPIVVEIDGRLQLISPTSKATLAYDPRTGEELWRVRYSGFSATARPLFGRGMFFLNTGFSKADLYAVKAGGQGDVTDSHVVWKTSQSVPSMPSQLLIDDLIYMIHDGGVATCLEADTGETVWQQRVGGQFSASPIYADGRIYFFNREGTGTVIAPGRDYKVLAANKLDDGCMASPAAAGQSLFVRTKTHLYRIEGP